MAKIYLDACALNSLTDDQRQSRIRTGSSREGSSPRMEGRTRMTASIVFEAELRRNPNREATNDALRLISLAGELLRPHPACIERARTLEALGYWALDALHLASAEQAFVDVLLTTDDRFIRQAERRLGKPTIRVSNRVNWIREMG